MSHCQNCGKRIGKVTRGNALYCSPKCRQQAYRKRKAVMLASKALTFDMDERMDLNTVRGVSVEMAEFLERLCAIAGKEVAREGLDAAWSLALHCGCDLSKRLAKS